MSTPCDGAIPSTSTSSTTLPSAKVTTNLELEQLKEKLRQLKLVETYKKKWPYNDLNKTVNDWRSVIQESFSALWRELKTSYPNLTGIELLQSLTTDRELAHIEDLEQSLKEVLGYDEEIEDNDQDDENEDGDTTSEKSE